MDRRRARDLGLLVDKAAGVSSHDVVQAVRKLLSIRRVGHTGTLDPFATGLLVLCIGRATRLARFLSGLPKSYSARVRFGYATDTYDRTGRPAGEDSGRSPGEAELVSALAGFRGPQKQIPPRFSAKKIDGHRSYALARAGVDVRPAAVDVEVHTLDLVKLAPPFAEIHLQVSSGTYVRSLAHDLGLRLGTGAHLDELRRTAVGSLGLEEAVTLGTVEGASASQRLERFGLEPHELLRDLPSVEVGPEEAHLLSHGRSAPDETGHLGPFRAQGPRGRLIAVCQARDGFRRPLVVWTPGSKNP